MDNFKQRASAIRAVANPYNTPMLLADSQGNQYMVPPTWWLVEFPSGLAATMPNETFEAQYERPFAAVAMEDFANTVADLRGSDRMAVQRAMELEARIASLEGLIKGDLGKPRLADLHIVDVLARLDRAELDISHLRALEPTTQETADQVVRIWSTLGGTGSQFDSINVRLAALEASRSVPEVDGEDEPPNIAGAVMQLRTAIVQAGHEVVARLTALENRLAP